MARRTTRGYIRSTNGDVALILGASTAEGYLAFFADDTEGRLLDDLKDWTPIDATEVPAEIRQVLDSIPTGEDWELIARNRLHTLQNSGLKITPLRFHERKRLDDWTDKTEWVMVDPKRVATCPIVDLLDD
jgi:hypothetical protein